ncbi:hypothetical protein P4O66_020163, partial [Electrophorus voltai]
PTGSLVNILTAKGKIKVQEHLRREKKRWKCGSSFVVNCDRVPPNLRQPGRRASCVDLQSAAEAPVKSHLCTKALQGLFENLVESDEGESSHSCPRAGYAHLSLCRLRPISEEEIGHLKEQCYGAIVDKQMLIDEKLNAELVEQEEKLRLEEEAICAAQRQAARLAKERVLKERPLFACRPQDEKLMEGHSTPWCLVWTRILLRTSHTGTRGLMQNVSFLWSSKVKLRNHCVLEMGAAGWSAPVVGEETGDAMGLLANVKIFPWQQAEMCRPSGGEFEVYLQTVKAQSEAFRTSRLSSDTNVGTPNTECSWDFTSKTRSTNDDATSLDLEWEDEEGMNRLGPVWERSKTEEDILRAALRPGGARLGSGPTSTSEDSNALEWENDFVCAHIEEASDRGDEEFEGFVNPALDTPSETAEIECNPDHQDR